MNIKITRIANGLLVEFTVGPTSDDPLGQRGSFPGPLFAHDEVELMGYISERVQQEFATRK